jgi:uncharacterized protein YigE (DUF2233 family)
MNARALFVVATSLLIPVFSFAAPKTDTGVQIRELEYRGNKYAILSVDLTKVKLKMFWKDAKGKPFNTFSNLERHLKLQHQELLASMNAGIFDKSFTPLGILAQRGQTLHKLSTRKKAYGNFYLQPNGVFFLDARGARILSTTDFIHAQPKVIEATQSGPMLVVNDKINSKFQPDSSNQLVRNGVGVENASKVYLVLTESWVNFYDFAAFFKDALHCQNALYLDGNISGLYVPNSSFDSRNDFAGMIGIVR